MPHYDSDSYAEKILVGGDAACPLCCGDDLVYESVEIEGSRAFQGVACQDCDASWYDVYLIEGYSTLKNGDGKEVE